MQKYTFEELQRLLEHYKDRQLFALNPTGFLVCKSGKDIHIYHINYNNGDSLAGWFAMSGTFYDSTREATDFEEHSAMLQMFDPKFTSTNVATPTSTSDELEHELTDERIKAAFLEGQVSVYERLIEGGYTSLTK